jgi:hypothetical protein
MIPWNHGVILWNRDVIPWNRVVILVFAARSLTLFAPLEKVFLAWPLSFPWESSEGSSAPSHRTD